MEEAKNPTAEEPKRLNFLEEIIEDDLKSGRVKSVMTRFPRNRTATFTSDTRKASA